MSEEKVLMNIDDVTMIYREEPVLFDISLDIIKNSITAIIGPNGAGKSTLLNGILNLHKPLTGSVVLYDTDILKNKRFYDKNENVSFLKKIKLFLSPKKEQVTLKKTKITKNIRKNIAYIPQKANVNWDFPITVYDVVMMGRYAKLGWIKRPGQKDKEIVLNAIKKLELDEYKNRQISELSGGQKQRVFLARAIAQESQFYIMDEPLQGIDMYTEKIIVDLFKEFKKEGKTILVVHHNLETVKEYFDHVIMLNKVVIASGKTEEVFTEENIKKTFKKV